MLTKEVFKNLTTFKNRRNQVYDNSNIINLNK